MNKDDVKKLDEITAEEAAAATQEAADEITSEELDKVNGGGMWGLIKRMKNAIHRCIEEDKN